MSYRVLKLAGGLCAALCFLAAPLGPQNSPALAQNGDAKPADQQSAAPKDAAKDAAKEVQKADEFAEAQHVLNGPAGNPECVWLGRRVVSLLWRDDLDTAFRHLDLYDRFGCPGDHLQQTFRCVARQGNIDPKSPERVSDRVHACWLNPGLPPIVATPSTPSGTSTQ